jgi:ankyrin repeat protein
MCRSPTIKMSSRTRQPMNINARDHSGRTRLHRAAADGDLRLVQQLLSNGADVNVADPGGMQPLHLAAISGNVEIVQLLIDHHAHIDAQTKLFWTPLLFAIWNLHNDCVECLCFKSAIVSKSNFHGCDHLLLFLTNRLNSSQFFASTCCCASKSRRHRMSSCFRSQPRTGNRFASNTARASDRRTPK